MVLGHYGCSRWLEGASTKQQEEMKHIKDFQRYLVLHFVKMKQ